MSGRLEGACPVVQNERLGDRRSELRFEILGELWGTLAMSQPLVWLNVGLGGALVDSSFAMPVGSTHRLRLSNGGDVVEFEAVVRHSELLGETPPRYRVGLEFRDLPEQARQSVAAMVRTGAPRPGGGEA
jgi:hypothetical protein